MQDIYELPIPDWGLGCPACHAPLAGLQQYRCSACGEAFDIFDVLAAHRPIPDLGVTCPNCDCFDALCAVRQAAEPAALYAAEPWICPACDEHVPASFEICWKCGKAHPLADA
jgi:hypothetical protein